MVRDHPHLLPPRGQKLGDALAQRSDLLADPPGHRHIVGIHPREPFTTRQAEACCRGSDNPGIKLVLHEPEPGIRYPRQGTSRSIAGSVIHRDEFKVAELLPQDTPDGTRKRRHRIAKGKDH